VSPEDAARAARVAAKEAEEGALHAARAAAEAERIAEVTLLEDARARVAAAADALAPLAEANMGLHMASFVQSWRQGVVAP
jgi:uncharacterized protein with PhoU and TrkA domain